MVIIQCDGNRRIGDADVRIGLSKSVEVFANLTVRAQLVHAVFDLRIKSDRRARFRHDGAGPGHIAGHKRALHKAQRMAVVDAAVARPNRRGGIIENTGSVPGGEVDSPRFSILTGCAAIHRQMKLIAVNVLADLTGQYIKTKFTGVMVPAMMPVHRIPRMLLAAHILSHQKVLNLGDSLSAVGRRIV